MTPRFAVSLLLCIWVLSITIPAVLSMAMEDNSMLVTMSGSEEEPGEGEKKDTSEEPLALPSVWQHSLGFSTSGPQAVPGISETPKEGICEIILPPPEYLLVFRTC